MLVVLLFAVLVAVWGGLIQLRWSRRIERARRDLAQPGRRVAP